MSPRNTSVSQQACAIVHGFFKNVGLGGNHTQVLRLAWQIPALLWWLYSIAPSGCQTCILLIDSKMTSALDGVGKTFYWVIDHDTVTSTFYGSLSLPNQNPQCLSEIGIPKTNSKQLNPGRALGGWHSSLEIRFSSLVLLLLRSPAFLLFPDANFEGWRLQGIFWNRRARSVTCLPLNAVCLSAGLLKEPKCAVFAKPPVWGSHFPSFSERAANSP